jgi:hypothetical protein
MEVSKRGRRLVIQWFLYDPTKVFLGSVTQDGFRAKMQHYFSLGHGKAVGVVFKTKDLSTRNATKQGEECCIVKSPDAKGAGLGATRKVRMAPTLGSSWGTTVSANDVCDPDNQCCRPS